MYVYMERTFFLLSLCPCGMAVFHLSLWFIETSDAFPNFSYTHQHMEGRKEGRRRSEAFLHDLDALGRGEHEEEEEGGGKRERGGDKGLFSIAEK